MNAIVENENGSPTLSLWYVLQGFWWIPREENYISVKDMVKCEELSTRMKRAVPPLSRERLYRKIYTVFLILCPFLGAANELSFSDQLVFNLNLVAKNILTGKFNRISLVGKKSQVVERLTQRANVYIKSQCTQITRRKPPAIIHQFTNFL